MRIQFFPLGAIQTRRQSGVLPVREVQDSFLPGCKRTGVQGRTEQPLPDPLRLIFHGKANSIPAVRDGSPRFEGIHHGEFERLQPVRASNVLCHPLVERGSGGTGISGTEIRPTSCHACTWPSWRFPSISSSAVASDTPSSGSSRLR